MLYKIVDINDFKLSYQRSFWLEKCIFELFYLLLTPPFTRFTSEKEGYKWSNWESIQQWSLTLIESFDSKNVLHWWLTYSYCKTYTFGTNNHISGFVSPGYNALKTSLLDETRVHIEELLQSIKGTWKDKGVTIVSGGWSDSKRRPLINFMVMTKGWSIFLKAVNVEGFQKNKGYISDSWWKKLFKRLDLKMLFKLSPIMLRHIGWRIWTLKVNFHTFWTPCVVHTLNLALKYICPAKNTVDNLEPMKNVTGSPKSPKTQIL